MDWWWWFLLSWHLPFLVRVFPCHSFEKAWHYVLIWTNMLWLERLNYTNLSSTVSKSLSHVSTVETVWQDPLLEKSTLPISSVWDTRVLLWQNISDTYLSLYWIKQGSLCLIFGFHDYLAAVWKKDHSSFRFKAFILRVIKLSLIHFQHPTTTTTNTYVHLKVILNLISTSIMTGALT